MHRLPAPLGAALLALSAITAGADLPAPPGYPRVIETLTLPLALELAWTQNPRVREAERAAEAAGYEVTGSYGGFLPSITVTDSSGHGAASSVQGSLPIWSGGLTLAQIKASKAREVAAEGGLVKTRLAVGGETLIAFHNLHQAQDQLTQWQKYLAALARLQTTIGNRAAAGVAPRADVETAISRVRQAEAGQESAQLLLSASRSELARLIELSPKSVRPESELASEVAALVLAPIAFAIDAHPDVRIAAAQVEEQRAIARQALAQLSPEIAVQYRHYYDGEEFVFDPSADEPLVVATYPLGNSFTAAQRYRSESTKVEGIRARLDSVRRDVEATLRLTREQLASSGRQYRLQQLAVASSQALVESFLRQYQVGRRSWVEVLNAQRELHELELGFIASRRAWLLSGHQLALQMLAWDLLLKPASATP